MRPAARQVGQTLLALVAMIVLGIGGLVFGELVPDRWVIDALEEAERTDALDAGQQPFDDAGTQIDRFTECITVSVGLGEAAGQSLLDTIALAPHLGPCDRLVDHLNPYDGARAAAEGGTYLRYWHGSAPIVRPVLAGFGIAGLRVVNLLTIAAAGSLLFGVTRRLAGRSAAVGLVAPYVLTTSIAALPGATNQALALAAGIGTAAMVGTVAAGGLGPSRVWYPSLVAGAVFVYVDLLTVVPGVWVLTASLVAVAALRAGAGAAATAGWALLAGAGWLVGYAGMWAGKWVFAAAVLGHQRVYDDVTGTIEQRINGESPWSEPGFGNAIEANVDVFLDRPFVALLLAAALVSIIAQAARRPVRELAARAVVASTTGVVFVWFEIASNHSQIHAWFTYRSLAIVLGVVLMAALARPPQVSEPDPATP